MASGFKTGGRKQGTPNKISGEIKEVLSEFLQKEINSLPEYFNAIEHKERLEVIVKLLPYVLPKMKPEQELDEKDEKDDQMKIIITRRVIGEDGRERLEEYNHRGPTISIPD